MVFYNLIVQLLSHVQLCNFMDYSTRGFPVLHYFLEFAQIHVYWVSDANQLSLCYSLRSYFLLPLSLKTGPSLHAPKHAHTIPLHGDYSQTASLVFLGNSPFSSYLHGGSLPLDRREPEGKSMSDTQPELLWPAAFSPQAPAARTPWAFPWLLDILSLPLNCPQLPAWPQTP